MAEEQGYSFEPPALCVMQGRGDKDVRRVIEMSDKECGFRTPASLIMQATSRRACGKPNGERAPLKGSPPGLPGQARELRESHLGERGSRRSQPLQRKLTLPERVASRSMVQVRSRQAPTK